MTSPAMMTLATAAMMVAMMLPSLAPTLWRQHRSVLQSTLLGVGYLSVWTTIGVLLSALPTWPVSPGAVAALVLCAGVVQCSSWKSRQLHRCRDVCAPAHRENPMTSWVVGCRLGVDCCLSCAAPMAVLYVTGLMDVRMMMLITAAITAERVAPGGARIARVTGGVALVAGLSMFV
jgi:predicted metal-binding membrane protein